MATCIITGKKEMVFGEYNNYNRLPDPPSAGKLTHQHWVYLVLTLLLIATAFSMYLIKFDLTLKANGIIRPVMEPFIVKAPGSGKVSWLNVRENEKVEAGQRLLELETTTLSLQLSLLQKQTAEQLKIRTDLKNLLNYMAQRDFSPHLSTSLIRSELQNYLYELRRLNAGIREQQSLIGRNKQLYINKMLSEVEMENFRQELNRLQVQKEIFISGKKVEWEQRLLSAETKLLELSGRESELKENIDSRTLLSSAEGVVQDLRVSVETQVTAGEALLSIIPDTLLIVELWVSPAGIGYVRVDQKVDLAIHAFRSEEWGTLEGTIFSIAEDISIRGEQAVYRVRCTLDRATIPETMYLKKGMSLTAFLILRRVSIYDFLFQGLKELMLTVNGNPPIHV